MEHFLALFKTTQIRLTDNFKTFPTEFTNKALRQINLSIKSYDQTYKKQTEIATSNEQMTFLKEKGDVYLDSKTLNH